MTGDDPPVADGPDDQQTESVSGDAETGPAPHDGDEAPDRSVARRTFLLAAGATGVAASTAGCTGGSVHEFESNPMVVGTDAASAYGMTEREQTTVEQSRRVGGVAAPVSVRSHVAVYERGRPRPSSPATFWRESAEPLAAWADRRPVRWYPAADLAGAISPSSIVEAITPSSIAGAVTPSDYADAVTPSSIAGAVTPSSISVLATERTFAGAFDPTRSLLLVSTAVLGDVNQVLAPADGVLVPANRFFPRKSLASGLPASGDDLVYVPTWEQEVSGLTDPELREAALGSGGTQVRGGDPIDAAALVLSGRGTISSGAVQVGWDAGREFAFAETVGRAEVTAAPTTVVVVSTPAARVFGQKLNPVAAADLGDLLTGDRREALLEAVGVDPSTVVRPFELASAISPSDLAGAISPSSVVGAVSPSDLAGAVTPSSIVTAVGVVRGANGDLAVTLISAGRVAVGDDAVVVATVKRRVPYFGIDGEQWLKEHESDEAVGPNRLVTREGVRTAAAEAFSLFPALGRPDGAMLADYAEPPSFDLAVGEYVSDSATDDGDLAVVVATPDATVADWVVYGDETVADHNPDYDPDEPVVVVAFERLLDAGWGGWTDASSADLFDAVVERGIKFHAFPASRLQRHVVGYPGDG